MDADTSLTGCVAMTPKVLDVDVGVVVDTRVGVTVQMAVGVNVGVARLVGVSSTTPPVKGSRN